MLLCLQGYDYIIHYQPGKEMVLSDTLSHFNPHPGPDIHCTLPFTMLACPREEGSISTSLCEWSQDAHSCQHHHQLARWHKGSSLPLMSILPTLWDPHHWRWPCPLWRSPHCSSFRKGENTTSMAPVPSRNHQSPVTGIWMHLLAWYKWSHWRSCLLVWDLHMVPSPECCSTPHTYTSSILSMADVCNGHLYSGRSWLPHMWQLLLKDDPHLMSPIWPEQHQQSYLTAQGNVLWGRNPRSPLLWQWSSIHEWPVHWILHFLGYHPQDLKPSLSTIKWICRGMCKIGKACAPTC